MRRIHREVKQAAEITEIMFRCQEGKIGIPCILRPDGMITLARKSLLI